MNVVIIGAEFTSASIGISLYLASGAKFICREDPGCGYFIWAGSVGSVISQGLGKLVVSPRYPGFYHLLDNFFKL